MTRPATMKPTEYFDLLNCRATRRMRAAAFLTGAVFGYLCCLATWALWYAVANPATWEVR